MKKKIHDFVKKIPSWVSWVLVAIPITDIIDPIALQHVFEGWGMSASLAALIVAKLLATFKDPPGEKIIVLDRPLDADQKEAIKELEVVTKVAEDKKIGKPEKLKKIIQKK